MLLNGRVGRFAIAMLGLTVVACGDDNAPTPYQPPEVDGSDVHRGDAGPDLDASRGLDAARSDAQAVVHDDGAVVQGSEGAVEPSAEDAAASTLDAAQPAAQPDAAPSNGQPDAAP